jgi:glucose/arabinose dehydrogenase
MKRWCLVAVAMVLLSAVIAPASAQPTRPTLTVTVVRSGLDIPWDVAFLPDGSMLYTERARKRLTLREPDGDERILLDAPPGMWSSGETGLMSIEVAADFATTHDIITCHGFKSATTQDVRVVRWHLDDALTTATIKRTLVRSLPSTSGRHGGCALLKGPGNTLYIGTGDAATGTNAQSLFSGGGKVLRVDASTGGTLPGNPFRSSANLMKRKVFTYGHRNVQGLARRADGRVWSVEHGSYRDDEVNLLHTGGNYGWNPVPRRSGDPSYNEGANSPMTDDSLPGKQIKARWRSGDPTVATSGATFVSGSAWGAWNGALVVTALKDSSVRILLLSSSGTLLATWKPAVLDGTYGRLRAAVRGPDGSVYLTTSNGSDDKILKVTPSSS